MKDIGLLVERDNGDDDSLGFNAFQVGLRQHPHSLTAAVLGEDKRVTPQAHGARLKAVPVNPDGLLTGPTRALLCKTKAGHKSEQVLIIEHWEASWEDKTSLMCECDTKRHMWGHSWKLHVCVCGLNAEKRNTIGMQHYCVFLCFFFSLCVNFTRVSPEHLVQFVGGHAAAIIDERQTEVIRFMNYIYPELFSGHTGVWGIV